MTKHQYPDPFSDIPDATEDGAVIDVLYTDENTRPATCEHGKTDVHILDRADQAKGKPGYLVCPGPLSENENRKLAKG